MSGCFFLLDVSSGFLQRIWYYTGQFTTYSNRKFICKRIYSSRCHYLLHTLSESRFIPRLIDSHRPSQRTLRADSSILYRSLPERAPFLRLPSIVLVIVHSLSPDHRLMSRTLWHYRSPFIPIYPHLPKILQFLTQSTTNSPF